jgi:hypothetical protein
MFYEEECCTITIPRQHSDQFVIHIMYGLATHPPVALTGVEQLN